MIPFKKRLLYCQTQKLFPAAKKNSEGVNLCQFNYEKCDFEFFGDFFFIAKIRKIFVW